MTTDYLRLLPRDLWFQLNGYRLNLVVARPHVKLVVHPPWDMERIELKFSTVRMYCKCFAHAYGAGCAHSVVYMYSAVTIWEDLKEACCDSWFYHECHGLM